MPKILIALLFILSSGYALAQTEAYIYPSTADYKAGKPIVSPLLIEKRSKGTIVLSGGSDYKITHPENKELSKKLRKEYFLVMCNDSLFVNCHFMGGNWYGLSFYRNNQYIFFVGCASSLLDNNEFISGQGVIVGGLVGADAATARYNYVIDLENKSTHLVEPAYMKKIFGETELYERYKNEKNPYLTETVKKYLAEFYK